MKNIIFLSLITIIILFHPTKSMAQFGIKAGPSISDIAFRKDGQTPYLGYEINDLEHRKPLPTFQIGAFGIFEIWEKIHFQPELLFITQGLDYSTKYLYDDIGYKVKLNYLHVPLLFKYQFSPEKKRHFGLLLGPYSSLKLKATRVTEFEGEKEKLKMSKVKRLDFGVIAGLSLDFDVAGKPLIIDFRTSYSYLNMMERLDGFIPWYYGSSKEYVRNISISLTVGYQFLQLKK